MARETSYKTATELEAAINAYFDTISRRVPMTYPVHVGYTSKGKPKYKLETVKSESGETIMHTQYAVPPGIAGLCIHLGISRQTLRNYAKDNAKRKVIDAARLRIEAYLEGELMQRDKVDGVKFNLGYNYGWRSN